MEYGQARAKTLLEALPYLQHYAGQCIVIKYGGNAMVDEDLKKGFARDIVLLKQVGIHPVVVHGGGPQIGQLLKKIGKQSEFIQGMRVTDKETMDVVEMVLAGLVNKEIVANINASGGRAVGLSGKDGGLICARKMLFEKDAPELNVPEIIDLGHVGSVHHINPEILHMLEKDRFIPVIAPVGYHKDENQSYNINADLVAGAIAQAIGAAKLILLTDVAGVLDENKQLQSTLTQEQVADWLKRGIINGGMIPKVNCCMEAISHGVGKAHIIDGRIPHSLLLEILTDEGVGTAFGPE
ncbi:MAG: acetylglutamate kinase [Zetaproteobacteria bacterium CG12_big_fil_rev_8_21_14_0_65_55_1124]|nr:MAG: acetylglutamate kinase [Zetaproteobacteria bacterium CG1_02_55_237]PIS20260.1 MAG: acetylglutamate kinase [Zetaproteobacteria bacterium CG08_land_8_20_14_0_20_55_17]PIW43137.1 MAG: acetylglutamate kinase [Zetaproteobacteria bacterium CG12_big_fil_rev_8_21_14_0_65_55_1124]PIY52101.1 MAG: acetylglutamate kinase [Zetaproteobacteria bacterium CG_4_10_14_0_8_um_filter_55_43]PIZ38113.1 MAG: acetylglutamate kinase [Zetaproteobacteria bacterium CG_4_10_14_0_2_um_filter_55_20]PJB79476.1 MAG: ac